MAGYVLYHDAATVATVLYCELHPHCDVKDHAKLAFYENELCQRLVMEIRVTVGTICCEKVGVNCSCFCIDGHQFSTRTCAERKLWLRAISNIKVKLQNRAPTPTGEDIRHYRSAIEEHIDSIRTSLEGLGPIDALLQRLPRRPPEQRGGYATLRDAALGIPSSMPSRTVPPMLSLGTGFGPARPSVSGSFDHRSPRASPEVDGATVTPSPRDEAGPPRPYAGSALPKPSSLAAGSPDADDSPVHGASPQRFVAAAPRNPGPTSGPMGGATSQSEHWRPQELPQPAGG